MMTLDFIIDTLVANCDRGALSDTLIDAFYETYHNYHMEGKYYRQTLECPAEYPEFIADGYGDYVDMVVDELLGYFSDYDKADRQIIYDNIEKICSELDADFYDEEKYTEKATNEIGSEIDFYGDYR